MTKFKEYLKNRGIKLQCDYEANRNGIVELGTKVLDNGVAVGVHHERMGYQYAVYNRSGDCSYFNQFGFEDYMEDSRDDVEYIAFLLDMGYDNDEWALTVMRFMYCNDAEVRMAFKHMKAGIMDEEVFHRWLDKCCLRYMSILDL